MEKENNSRRIGTHLLFWTLFILYEIINYGWNNSDYIDLQATHELWTDLPMMICIVYVNLYWLMPKYLYPRKYVKYIFCLFTILLIGGLYGRWTGYSIWTSWDKMHHYQEYLAERKDFFIPLRIARNTLNFYPVVALTMLIKVLRNSYQKERILRETESEKHKVEISFLRAQIHPHFFFNTLSSLYALTLKKSPKAPDVVMRLSGLMHYMLYESNAELVSLESEIEHLKNYISIEEIRFGHRFECSFRCSGEIAGKLISPLLLLPFVENAFKHSHIDGQERAWITIDINVAASQLFFKIENSHKRREPPANSGGLGLKNVKKRLQLAYPHGHHLEISDQEDVFRVFLKLQLNEKN